MIDSTKVDLNQLPKKLCDGAIGGFSKELFSFVLTSGNNLDSFAVTPSTMKSISVWMNGQVTNYEKAHGVIEVNPHSVESPIQPSDFK